MRKFIFQLEAFLKISSIAREKAEIAMAAAIQNLAKQKQVLLSLEDELQSGLDEYDALLGGKSVNVGMMQIYNDFFDWKRDQITLQKTAVRNAGDKRKKCLQDLLEAQKKVETLEQLRQKRFDEYKYEALAEEQKQIDEIGLQVHMRKIQTEE